MNYPCSSTKSAETSPSTKVKKKKTKSRKRASSTPPNAEHASVCRNDSKDDEDPQKNKKRKSIQKKAKEKFNPEIETCHNVVAHR